MSGLRSKPVSGVACPAIFVAQKRVSHHYATSQTRVNRLEISFSNMITLTLWSLRTHGRLAAATDPA